MAFVGLMPKDYSGPTAKASDLHHKSARACTRRDRIHVILDVAERAFIERGFAATSMSRIAADCGGSKTTLWNHFSSKEQLFSAYLDRRVSAFGEMLDQALIASGPMEAVLSRFATIFLTKVMSAEASSLRRLIGAESHRFPHLADAFFECGPKRVRSRLERYFEEHMTTGELRNGDPDLAVRQFLALCEAGKLADIIWHGLTSSSETPAVHEVDQAVEAFLRIWKHPAFSGGRETEAKEG